MRVLAIAAISADGYIARTQRDDVSWSSSEDKRMFAATSRHAGVVVMGRKTFDSMPGPLPDRLQVVMTSTPESFQSLPGRVEFTANDPRAILRDLAERQFQEVIIGGGGAVYSQFVSAGLLDELWLTIEPLLFGAGVPLLRGSPLERRMRLVSVTQLAPNTLQLKYAFDRADAASA
ncbi:MAG: dihydrofolate reductase family protein [Ktedonobacterales bacterium]